MYTQGEECQVLNFVSWNAFLVSTAVYNIQWDPVRSGPVPPIPTVNFMLRSAVILGQW